MKKQFFASFQKISSIFLFELLIIDFILDLLKCISVFIAVFVHRSQHSCTQYSRFCGAQNQIYFYFLSFFFCLLIHNFKINF